MEWHRRLFLVFLGPPNEARVTTTLLICFGLPLINRLSVSFSRKSSKHLRVRRLLGHMLQKCSTDLQSPTKQCIATKQCRYFTRTYLLEVEDVVLRRPWTPLSSTSCTCVYHSTVRPTTGMPTPVDGKFEETCGRVDGTCSSTFREKCTYVFGTSLHPTGAEEHTEIISLLSAMGCPTPW